MTIVAATGHRPSKLGGYGDEAYARLVKLARWYLLALAEPPAHVISGMALGWDQAFAEAAVQLGIPFVAAIPFKGQESKWPAASVGKYHALLEFAGQVHVVSEGGYSARKMHARNEWMVDNCDLLCAVWDGSAGGTAGCVAYARRMHKAVDNIHDMLSEF